MNKLFRSAGILLLIAVLVFSLAACGQRTVQQPVESTPTVEPTKEIVVETPPPSPTPTPTPTPSVSVPPVAVTTVPMPMPSVSPTVAVTNEPVPTDANGNPITTASPTVSPSPSASPSPTPTPYSYDAAFASTIMPDSVTIPENAEEGVINANGVILRGGPSASAVILDTFDIGTRVAILGMDQERLCHQRHLYQQFRHHCFGLRFRCGLHQQRQRQRNGNRPGRSCGPRKQQYRFCRSDA